MKGDVRGMVSGIGETMAALRAIRENYARAEEETAANWRLSDPAKKEALSAYRAAQRESVVHAARSIFGESGRFWAERDVLRAKLRDARDRAETLDAARLANTYRRVPSIVTGYQTVQELAAWYRDGADTYERRALQDTGAEPIGGRFRGQSEVGGLLAELRRDRAEAMATPEVRAAEESIALLEKEAYEAHGELHKHLAEVGEGGVLSDGARVLAGVRVDVRFDDVSRLDAKARYTVERVLDTGYIPIKE